MRLAALTALAGAPEQTFHSLDKLVFLCVFFFFPFSFTCRLVISPETPPDLVTRERTPGALIYQVLALDAVVLFKPFKICNISDSNLVSIFNNTT